MAKTELKCLLALILLALSAWLALSEAKATEAPRCAHLAPICHLGAVPLCLCDAAWRSSCEWHCVVFR